MGYLIDVSNNQGLSGGIAALDDPSVIGGYGKGTEGLGFRDPDYHAFYDEAKKRGKPFGPYLFLHPSSDPRAQARLLLSFCKPVPGDLQPVVDSEITDGAGMGAVATATYAALDELRLHGFDPILYASTSWLQTIVSADPRLKQFRVWQAEYGPVAHRIPGLRYLMWQFTDRLVVAKGRLRVDGDKLLVASINALRIPKKAVVKHPVKPAPKKPVAVVVHPTTTTTSGSTTNVHVTLTPIIVKKPKPSPVKPKPKAPAKPKPVISAVPHDARPKKKAPAKTTTPSPMRPIPAKKSAPKKSAPKKATPKKPSGGTTRKPA